MITLISNVIITSVACLCAVACQSNPRSIAFRKIDAGVKLLISEKTIFFSGDEFIEYDFHYKTEKYVKDIIDTEYQAIYVPETFSIKAVYTEAPNLVVLLGDGIYIKKSEPDGQKISEGNLTDLGLPNGVDAAIRWNEKTLVFEGNAVYNTLAR